MKKKEYILPNQNEERMRRKEISYEAFPFNSIITNLGKGKKYYIRTYGCQANVRDGESLSGMLEMMGFSHTEDLWEADVLICNTCAVRQTAEERVFGEIGNLKEYQSLVENNDEICKYLDIINSSGNNSQQQGINNNNNVNPYNDITFPSDSY